MEAEDGGGRKGMGEEKKKKKAFSAVGGRMGEKRSLPRQKQAKTKKDGMGNNPFISFS